MRLALICVGLVLLASFSSAAEPSCLVYFTGIGCPHCANADPYIFSDFLASHPEVVLIEYEVYQHDSNPQVLVDYLSSYGIKEGIPKIMIGAWNYLVGDEDILEKLEVELTTSPTDECLLMDSSKIFSELDLNTLPGEPVLWNGKRVAFKVNETSSNSSELVKKILFGASTGKFIQIEPQVIYFSGGSISFDHAVVIDNWIVQWNNVDHKENMNYGLMQYLDYFIYVILILGFLVIVFITLSERKKIKDAGVKQETTGLV